MDAEAVKYVHGSYLARLPCHNGVFHGFPFQMGPGNGQTWNQLMNQPFSISSPWLLPGAFSSQRHERQLGQLGTRMLVPRHRGHGRWCRVGFVLEVSGMVD